MVDAFFYEVALDASRDPGPLSPGEEAADRRMVEAFEQLKAMSPEELRAEHARRLRARRLLEDG